MYLFPATYRCSLPQGQADTTDRAQILQKDNIIKQLLHNTSASFKTLLIAVSCDQLL